VTQKPFVVDYEYAIKVLSKGWTGLESPISFAISHARMHPRINPRAISHASTHARINTVTVTPSAERMWSMKKLTEAEARLTRDAMQPLWEVRKRSKDVLFTCGVRWALSAGSLLVDAEDVLVLAGEVRRLKRHVESMKERMVMEECAQKMEKVADRVLFGDGV
jgi:hypothetical protein